MKSEKIQKKQKHKKSTNEGFSEKFFKKPLYSYIILIIVCIAVYAQVAGFGITRFDDNLIIFNNMKFLNETSNIPKAFTTDAFMTAEGKASLYRPLQTVSFIIDAKLSGDKPIAYHISNLLLHCLTCLSILLLLRLLGISNVFSFLLTLIFAVNPIFTINVAWLPARGDLLLGLFAVLSFIGLIKFQNAQKYIYLALHLLCFALAAFSKETGLVLPILFYFYILLVSKKKILSINNLFYSLGYLVIAAFWFILHDSANLKPLSDQVFGIIPFFKNLQVIPETIFKFIFPFYLPPLPAFNLIFTILGCIIIILIIIYGIKNNTFTNPIFLFGLLWLLILSIPGMFYRHEKADIYYDYLDHRAYLPLIGILFLIPFLFSKKIINLSAKLKYVMVGIVFLFAILSFIRAKNFNDPVSFYTYAISGNPKAAVAYANLGVYLNDTGKWREALEDFNKALEIKPDYADIYINRGLCKKNLNDIQGSLDDYSKAIEAKAPNIEFAYFNRAALKQDIKDYLGSIVDFTEAINLNSKWAEAYTNRGNSKYQSNDSVGAMADYTKSIEINPVYEMAYYNRGTAYGKSGLWDKSYEDLNKAIQINPNFSDAYMNRANVHIAMKNMAGACSDWKEAQKRGAERATGMIQQYCR